MDIGIKNLQQILGAAYQVLVDSGTTTDGSGTTLEDTTKSWVADELVHDRVEFTIDTTLYRRIITSNTDTEFTFAALPAGVSVAGGITYEIWRYVGVSDLTDRAARLLGIIYGNVDQLQQTTAKNLKASIEERLILKTIRDIAPEAVGTFWLPETGNIDLSKYLASSWGIYAPTTATMVINCYLNISHDGGTTWRRAAGYEILDADFIRDVWNTIDCPLKLAEAKLEVVIGTAYPAELDLICIAKP